MLTYAIFTGYFRGLYSTLIAIKSFLDLYSRLIARSLMPSASVFGFNSGNYNNRNVSGGRSGRFLRWIERSTPRSFENRERLLSIPLAHVDNWVDEAVRYRDAVVHVGFVAGMNEAMLPLDKAISELQETDVVLPKMPNGIAVTDYCNRAVAWARALVSETLPLLPGVDLGLVVLDKV